MKSVGYTSGTFQRSVSLVNGRVPVPKALIFHGTTCFYKNFSVSKRDINTIWIGRFMIERMPVSGLNQFEHFTISCATKMDEVW